MPVASQCGRSSMVERELPKLYTRVRFPSPAPEFPLFFIKHRQKLVCMCLAINITRHKLFLNVLTLNNEPPTGIRLVLSKFRMKGKGWVSPAFGGHLTFLKMNKTKTRQIALPKNAMRKRLSIERVKSYVIASHIRASIVPVEGAPWYFMFKL